MRRLVVNADDLGADEARNEGIFEAIAAGVVMSVSVLANGPALADAAKRLGSLPRGRVSVGGHLNFSEGRPLCADLEALVGADGAFLGKQPARARLLEAEPGGVAAEVERELEEQLCRLEDCLGALDHVDGHQHVHLFPAVFPLVVRAAEHHHIGWVRTPDEPAGDPRLPGEDEALSEENRFFAHWGAIARRALCSHFVRAPSFRGLALRARPELPVLAAVVDALPAGLTELMVHPGKAADPSAGPFSRFSTRQREEELAMLLSSSFGEWLHRAGVKLCPFPSACA